MMNLRNIQIYTAVLMLLLSHQNQGLCFEKQYETLYNCYVDVCGWTKYCDHISKRCEDCSTRFHDCFTPGQEPNCTVFCVTYQPCPRLKPLLHGHHNGSDRQEYMYGSKVNFACEVGYQNIGATETICQNFGKWSHLELNVSQPLCKENQCMIPNPPLHGRVEFPSNTTEFVVGSKVSFSCEAGYNMQGKDSNWTCLTNGTWNGTLPECVVNFCKSPTSPTNGGIRMPSDLEHFVTGTFITYTCNEGFRLQGGAKRECLPNGDWSINPAICLAIEPSPKFWMIAAITTGCLLFVTLLGGLISILLKFCRKGRSYEKIPQTNDPDKKLKTGDITLEKNISQTTIPPAEHVTIDMKTGSENTCSLKEQRQVILHTPKPSKVINRFYKSKVKCVIGDNTEFNVRKTIHSAQTNSTHSEESSESISIADATDALIETDQNDTQNASLRPDLPMDSLDHDKILERIHETTDSTVI